MKTNPAVEQNTWKQTKTKALQLHRP